MTRRSALTRRTFLGGLGLAGLAGGAAAARRLLPGAGAPTAHAQGHGPDGQMPMTHNMVEGDVDPAANGFDPTAMLTDFDYGKTSTLPSGQTLRDYTIVAQEKLIEIAPGVTFPAWVYNGRVPGPTIRCTQGDRLRITFINSTSHPHSIHFHGIHRPSMDGLTPVQPGEIPQSYGLARDIVAGAPSLRYRPTAGDVVLFNTRNPHEVAGGTAVGDGSRISIGSFVGRMPDGRLVMWS